MSQLRTEQRLGALAEQLIGHPKGPATASELKRLRVAIRDGDDPLGAQLIDLRSAETRRATGTVYTPRAIVDAMVDWAAREPGERPERIVDPGSGSGRFLLAAARIFPRAELLAVEIDPLAAKLLRANATVAGLVGRLKIYNCDFRTAPIGRISGRTLFIGNPPYVRHHQISKDAKDWYRNITTQFGIRASKLAGLHIHFFMRTRELAKVGDIGAYITSSEWMDVNYGSALRNVLADGLGGAALHVLDPEIQPFDNAMTTGVITCFRVGHRPSKFAVRAVAKLSDLRPLSAGRETDWDTVKKTTRWSTLARPARRKPPGFIELGELFRVHRGQVTGCNAVWIAGTHATELPHRLLIPTVTRAREILACEGDLCEERNLRCVIDLPLNLEALADNERVVVDRFLRWAKSCGADKSYVARSRRAWWSVGVREPPPILCTYMARRPPAFARNTVRASYLNIAHGLYPIERLTEIELTAILKYLRRSVSIRDGRMYAGGLVKFEPGEVERLLIPTRERLAENMMV